MSFEMITLKCPENPKQLGDAIDTLFLGHMISYVEKCRVNVQINHPDHYLLNKFVSFADVVVGKETIGKVLTFQQNTEGFKLYHHYTKQVNPIPMSKIKIEKDIPLPEKFITTQWDAQQIYRRVDKYDKDRCNQIESFYKKMGYDVIRVGGEGKYKKLEDIIYVMSKARLHVGVGSGMMHIAKFLMPPENIHYYHNVKERHDARFPDGLDVAWMGREIIRRGARLNYWDNNTKQEEYFSDVSLYHDT